VPRSHYKTLQGVPPEVGQRAEGGHHPHEPNAVASGGNTCVVRDGSARVRLPSGTWRKPVTKEEKSEAVGGRSRGGGSSHAHRCVPAARLDCRSAPPRTLDLSEHSHTHATDRRVVCVMVPCSRRRASLLLLRSANDGWRVTSALVGSGHGRRLGQV
jgi:hypothetical protein